ncbi:MAG: hypothetical protein MK165_15490 [Pirellulaceae bacterium]|nr:hypothetical protein [Pirellulaceae bacterium]
MPRQLLRAFCLFTMSLGAANLAAQSPQEQLQFDTPATVECFPIEDKDFGDANPDERLLQAHFPISTFVPSTLSEYPLELHYRIESTNHSARIFDYNPKTTLTTNIAGTIVVENTEETTKSLGISLAGEYQRSIRGSASGDAGTRTNQREQFDRLPTLELLTASGTIHRGRGVYFKLKPSSRESSEGTKTFLLVVCVPTTWRGDLFRINCEALAIPADSLNPLAKTKTHRRTQFFVAAHLSGDPEAKRTAKIYTNAEEYLRQIAVRQQLAIQNKRFPTAVHRIGAAIDIFEPKLPATWLESILNHQPPIVQLEELPRDVANTAEEFIAARNRLHALSGKPYKE